MALAASYCGGTRAPPAPSSAHARGRRFTRAPARRARRPGVQQTSESGGAAGGGGGASAPPAACSSSGRRAAGRSRAAPRAAARASRGPACSPRGGAAGPRSPCPGAPSSTQRYVAIRHLLARLLVRQPEPEGRGADVVPLAQAVAADAGEDRMSMFCASSPAAVLAQLLEARGPASALLHVARRRHIRELLGELVDLLLQLLLLELGASRR